MTDATAPTEIHGTGHRPSQEQRDALCAEIAKGTPGMTVTAEPFRGCFHQESTTFTVRVGAIHVEADDDRLHDRIAAADPTLAGDVYEELAFALLSKLATHGQDLTLHRKLRRLALEFIDRRRQIIAEAKAAEKQQTTDAQRYAKRLPPYGPSEFNWDACMNGYGTDKPNGVTARQSEEADAMIDRILASLERPLAISRPTPQDFRDKVPLPGTRPDHRAIALNALDRQTGPLRMVNGRVEVTPAQRRRDGR